MEYLAVHLVSFPLDTVVDFDLYLRKADLNYVLYRARELPFTGETRDKLLYYQVDALYVQGADKRKYQQYVEKHLTQIISDPSIPSIRKADILYHASASMMEELIEQPGLGDNIARSAGVAKGTVEYLLHGRESFFNLLAMSQHDYYTYTHSVHVCTYSIVIAQAMGLTDKALLDELATGALLHDIGKSRIAKEIINKKGALAKEEMEEMKKHPLYGLEIARESGTVPSLAYIPIIQHQEKIDGTGYPYGLTRKDMHMFGRITAIADVFDAITTNRSYSKAKTFFEALKFMAQERGTHLDSDLLMAFINVLGDR